MSLIARASTPRSSSATTSLIVPLAGTGVLNLRQIYPYTLGANVGTTVTAILASYRGYDTWGETTVIFTACVGVMLLLGGARSVARRLTRGRGVCGSGGAAP